MSTRSVIALVLTVLLAVVIISICRLLWILPSLRIQPRSPRQSSSKILIVLGSGGHTAEMLRLIEPLDFDKYTRRVYVVSSGDSLSESKAQAFELRKQGPGDRKVLHDVSF